SYISCVLPGLIRSSLCISDCFPLFFLSCCRHHRDLHSFPTRRSSDLSVGTSRPGEETGAERSWCGRCRSPTTPTTWSTASDPPRSEEHTSELQSRFDLVCRLLLEKKKSKYTSKADMMKKISVFSTGRE